MSTNSAVAVNYDPDGDCTSTVGAAKAGIGMKDRHDVTEPQVFEPKLPAYIRIEELHVKIAADRIRPSNS